MYDSVPMTVSSMRVGTVEGVLPTTSAADAGADGAAAPPPSSYSDTAVSLVDIPGHTSFRK